MKSKLLLLCVLLAGCFVFSQPAVKLYAFTQDVLPGTVPVGVTDENGNSANASRARHSTLYYLYLTHNNRSKISVTGLWIDGKRHQFQTEVNIETPVIKTSHTIPDDPQATILVPKTPDKVIRLSVQENTFNSSATTATEKKLLAGQRIMVRYKWKEKTYYKTIKVLKKLNPIAHQ